MDIEFTQTIDQIVDDNLMSKNELMNYIYDDFRVNLLVLKKIVVHLDDLVKLSQDYTEIAHQRYKLFYKKKAGELHVFPIDGLLREGHIRFEISILNKLLSKNIELVVEGHLDLDTEVERLVNKIVEKCDGRTLDNIIIGSLWNFNFMVNSKVRPNFLNDLISKEDNVKIDKYIDYRIRLSIIEEYLLQGEIKLAEADQDIFREGFFPDIHDLQKIKTISSEIVDIENILNIKKQDQELVSYLIVDYLYFNDVVDGTNKTEKITDFQETKIYFDKFISFQIINFNNKTNLNIGWVNPMAISKIIQKISDIYDIKNLYMYGKCGSISKDINVGSIVSPTLINEIIIKNACNVGRKASFCSVMSPLIETKSWLKKENVNDIKCVEMELYETIKATPISISKFALFYVSDNPSGTFKLSNRFDFLTQRLFCVKNILNNI